MSDQAHKFDSTIAALLDTNQPFPAGLLRSFSDLSRKDLHALEQVWLQIDDKRKLSLFEDLESVAETDTLVNFDEFAKLGLTDPNPGVRVMAIRLLWECEETRLIPILIDFMLSDPAEDVRAAAASALGKFVYLGELDSIADDLRISIAQNLLDVVKSEELPLVRRNALESLGYSSHSQVPELIKNALDSGDSQWLISALYAIGRSADDQWADTILKFMNHSENEVKFEAIRSAGELTLEDARDPLLDLLENEELDTELRYASIWSLSQIGGEGIKEKFTELVEDSDDEEEINWLEKALENLELGGDLDQMELMNFDDDSPESDEIEDDEDYETGLDEIDTGFDEEDEDFS
jgi:HEAT repeat protein